MNLQTKHGERLRGLLRFRARDDCAARHALATRGMLCCWVAAGRCPGRWGAVCFPWACCWVAALRCGRDKRAVWRDAASGVTSTSYCLGGLGDRLRAGGRVRCCAACLRLRGDWCVVPCLRPWALDVSGSRDDGVGAERPVDLQPEGLSPGCEIGGGGGKTSPFSL